MTTLFDALARQQIYIEGIKAGQTLVFAKAMRAISVDIKDKLSTIKYNQLDQMTKAELGFFLKTLRNSQSIIYSQYTSDLIDFLNQFMKKDHKLVAAIILGTTSKIASVPADEDVAWSAIVNAPIPASGLTLSPFLNSFSNKALADTINTVSRGYALKQDVRIVQAQLTGQKGLADKIFNGGRAVTNTAIQFVGSNANSQTAKSVFGWYQWVAVLDDKTSDICLDLDGQVFRTGDGPLPPAHINCRSHAHYLENSDPVIFSGWSNWIEKQPDSFVEDVFGSSAIGKSSVKFGDPKPLTLAQFVGKLDLMIGA